MIEGLSTFSAQLDDVAEDYAQELATQAREMAEEIASAARLRVYRNLETPKAYSPLAESIFVDDSQLDTVQVVCPQSYAHFVEFGTVNMRARPFLGPSVEEAKTQFSFLSK